MEHIQGIVACRTVRTKTYVYPRFQHLSNVRKAAGELKVAYWVIGNGYTFAEQSADLFNKQYTRYANWATGSGNKFYALREQFPEITVLGIRRTEEEYDDIKVIEKNDGVNIYEAGQKVTVGIGLADVMSYPVQAAE